MHRGIVIGHSFVSGLADHFAHRNGGPLSASEVAVELRVSDITAEVHLAGQRGGRITDPNFALPVDAIRQAQPHFAILNVGSNDLAVGTTAADQLAIATGTMALARELIDEHNVSVVVVCTVVDRYEGLPGITPNDFHEHLYHLNSMLMHFCQNEHNVHYHVMRGFWRNPITTWSWDGIHPNKPQGRTMYKKAIRKSIFLAVKHLTNNSVILHPRDLAALANNQ